MEFVQRRGEEDLSEIVLSAFFNDKNLDSRGIFSCEMCKICVFTETDERTRK